MTTVEAARVRRLLSSGVVYASSDAAVAVVGLVLVPFYARRLSAAEYGVLGLVATARVFLTPFVTLGLVGSARTLYLSRQGDARRRLVSTVLNATLIYGIASTTALTLIALRLFATSEAWQPYRTVVLLSLWTVFTVAAQLLPQMAFSLEQRPGRYAAHSIGLAVVGLAANVAFVGVFDLGVTGAVLAALVSGLAGVVVCVILLRRVYEPVIDREELRILIRLTLPTLPHVLASSGWRYADRAVIVATTSLTEAGVYSFAFAVASALPLALGGISTAFTPEIYKRAAADDPDLGRHWTRLFSIFVAVAAAGGLCVAVFAKELVGLAGASAFGGAAEPLPLLVLSQILVTVYWQFSPGINLAHRTWAYPASSLPALVLNVAMNLALVPMYGARGAAASAVASSGLQLVIFARLSMRAMPQRVDWRAIGTIAVAALAAFGASRFLPPILPGPSVLIRAAALGAFPVLLLVAGIPQSLRANASGGTTGPVRPVGR